MLYKVSARLANQASLFCDCVRNKFDLQLLFRFSQHVQLPKKVISP